MQDGTVTTKSRMIGWARSTVHQPRAIPGWVQVYTLCRVVRSIAIVASSVMDNA
jgi:ribosomal protein L39E